MRDRLLLVRWICAVLLAGVPGLLHADVKLPAVFTPHLVLQRDKPINVWGWAAPGEEVTVKFAEASAKATADQKGKWKVTLPAQTASATPRDLVVSGKNTITLNDVLVGEVWVGSGQSNMQWSVVASLNPKEEIAAAKYPNIRLFQIPLVPSGTPSEDVKAKWQACTPETIGNFSAVLYFFGRELNSKLDVPVGLIQTAWGGTRIQPWTPPVGFEGVPATQKELDLMKTLMAGYKTANEGYLKQVEEWLQKAKESLAAGADLPLAPPAPPHPLNSHNQPTGLYNGMVHAIVPYTIRGAIWYQGESNRMETAYYHELMKALIGGWRKVWGQGDFSFYFVQLAPFNYGKQAPYALAELWEAQTKTLSVPNTGMAVITDIGDIKDIHPRNKQEVGRRLALWALAKDYGKSDIVYTGPTFESMSVEGDKVRIKFGNAEGLKSRDGQPLTWFLIAGEDKKFTKANAVIEGNAVVVSAPGVSSPKAVRFGWHQLAEPNLANGAGLPPSPFRTDDWTEVTFAETPE